MNRKGVIWFRGGENVTKRKKKNRQEGNCTEGGCTLCLALRKRGGFGWGGGGARRGKGMRGHQYFPLELARSGRKGYVKMEDLSAGRGGKEAGKGGSFRGGGAILYLIEGEREGFRGVYKAVTARGECQKSKRHKN